MQYIITIAEANAPQDEHYRRRVELDDLNAVIQRLDGALNIKVRKPRSDIGKPRATEGAK